MAQGRRRYGALLVAAAVVIALLAFANAKVFSIKYIEVASQGAPVYTEAEIIERSGVSVGKSIFSVNPQKVQARLERDPALTVKDISRVFPDRVYITIVQHGPVAYVSHLDHWVTIGEGGEALNLNASADEIAGLIEIRGLAIRVVSQGDELVTETPDAVGGMCRILAGLREYELSELIEYIDMADAENIWMGIRDGCRVRLGPAANEKEKIRWLAAQEVQAVCLQDKEGVLELSVDSARFIPSKDESDDDTQGH